MAGQAGRRGNRERGADLGRKLICLRNLDARTMDLSMLPAERRRFLATVGRRSTVQALGSGRGCRS